MILSLDLLPTPFKTTVKGGFSIKMVGRKKGLNVALESLIKLLENKMA